MRTYDVDCPCCGHRNNALYLEDSKGWLECENCGRAVRVTNRFEKHLKIPVFTVDQHSRTIMT